MQTQQCCHLRLIDQHLIAKFPNHIVNLDAGLRGWPTIIDGGHQKTNAHRKIRQLGRHHRIGLLQ